MVQKIFCFCRGPTLGSQYQHGGAQLPVTPVPADLCALLVSVSWSAHTQTQGCTPGRKIKYS